MYGLLHKANKTGHQPWAQMYDEGHGDHWRATSRYVSWYVDIWRAALNSETGALSPRLSRAERQGYTGLKGNYQPCRLVADDPKSLFRVARWSRPETAQSSITQGGICHIGANTGNRKGWQMGAWGYLSFENDDAELALEAVGRVAQEESELAELWDDADEPEWREFLEDLSETLRTALR